MSDSMNTSKHNVSPQSTPQANSPKRSQSPYMLVIKLLLLIGVLMAFIFIAVRFIFTFYFLSYVDYKKSFLTWRLEYNDKRFFNSQWKFKKINRIDPDEKRVPTEGALYNFMQGNFNEMEKAKEERAKELETLKKEVEKSGKFNSGSVADIEKEAEKQYNENGWITKVQGELNHNNYLKFEHPRLIGVMNNLMYNYFPRLMKGFGTLFDFYDLSNMDDVYIVKYLLWRYRFGVLRGYVLDSEVALGIKNDANIARYGKDLKSQFKREASDIANNNGVIPVEIGNLIIDLKELIMLCQEQKNSTESNKLLVSKEKEDKQVVDNKLLDIFKSITTHLGLKKDITVSDEMITTQLHKLGMASPNVFTRVIYGHLFEIFYLLTLDVKIGQYTKKNEKTTHVVLLEDSGKVQNELQSDGNVNYDPKKPLWDFSLNRYKYVANVFTLIFSNIFGKDYEDKDSEKDLSSVYRYTRLIFSNKYMNEAKYKVICEEYEELYNELIRVFNANADRLISLLPALLN